MKNKICIFIQLILILLKFQRYCWALVLPCQEAVLILEWRQFHHLSVKISSDPSFVVVFFLCNWLDKLQLMTFKNLFVSRATKVFFSPFYTPYTSLYFFRPTGQLIVVKRTLSSLVFLMAIT